MPKVNVQQIPENVQRLAQAYVGGEDCGFALWDAVEEWGGSPAMNMAHRKAPCYPPYYCEFAKQLAKGEHKTVAVQETMMSSYTKE